MISKDWLKTSLILPQLATASAENLIRAVTEAFASVAKIDRSHIEAAFGDVLKGDGFSIGRGVAIPHIEIENLDETLVCLVTLRTPMPVVTIDNVPVDIFLFILSKPDPQAHLLLLAHLARLSQSRTFLKGLRRIQTPAEAIGLVGAAELRHSTITRPNVPPVPFVFIFISVGGEKAVDALLIDLVDQGVGDACILEAQSLAEAAAREVPLFAGFRDLFGNPEGRRMFVLETLADRVDTVLESIRRICDEYGAKHARVSVIPVQTRWNLDEAAERESKPGRGH